MKNKLDQQYLKECLTYDPDTGIFVWNIRPESHFKTKRAWNAWNTTHKNNEAGNIGAIGYRRVTINNRQNLCHRLAFLYMEGYLPENHIDHIDRDRSNNKWENLREVSRQCNAQNCKLSKWNTSGITGVSWGERDKRWISHIMVGGVAKRLGYFKNFDDAVMARYQEEISNPLWTCSTESTAYKYLKERNLI